MKSFKQIEAIAAKQHGGKEALENLLPCPKNKAAFKKITDDRILAEMTRTIFQAGFSWDVIEQKWPGFETAFHHFDISYNASLGHGEQSQLAQDTSIVRNRQKIETVKHNARLIQQLQSGHGTAAKFFADWPLDKQTELFEYLKKQAARLGGKSGPYCLRRLGLDVFILTNDVCAALIAHGPLSKNPTSKKDLALTQDSFNQWHQESGRPYSQISKILACSIQTD